MDARSIAATAINGGRLTAATDLDVDYSTPKYFFDGSIYEKRVFDGWGKADPAVELKFGPNIKDWPVIPSLTEHMLLRLVSFIDDPVTTTDELIPSGETSSYRSNPLRLAEFTLSRKDPAYVGEAKAVLALEQGREAGEDPTGKDASVAAAYEAIRQQAGGRRRPRAGRFLPAGGGGLGQHRPGVRHQALPLQLYQLGHRSLPHPG